MLTSPCGTARSAVASIQVFQCRSADINQDSDLTVQDIFDFLSLYFSNAPGGDFNDDSAISVQDIFDFLQSFFSVCV